MIGYALCGSFCTHKRAVKELEKIVQLGYEVQPIMSECVYHTDTRFGTAEALRAQVESICQRKIIHTIVDAEPLGPKNPLEALIICPCTGNTLAKIANGITDTAVCMAAKAQLRSDNPLIIALASNDALSANLRNIATLLSKKHVFFTPMVQDDPIEKPHSMVANFDRLSETFERAIHGNQYRKIFE